MSKDIPSWFSSRANAADDDLPFYSRMHDVLTCQSRVNKSIYDIHYPIC